MTKEILILGGGFAGLATAKTLEKHLRPKEANITLISRDNYILFTPMLPEVSSGTIETRHIVTPLRAELLKTRFVLGNVSKIDIVNRKVEVIHSIDSSLASFAYDHVVFALGAVTSTFNLPGVAQYTMPLKTLEDAEVLRNHVIATFELADVTLDPQARQRLLTFVVVGGGYTGVETTGELVDLFANIAKFYRSIKSEDISIILIEGGKSLLAELPPKMGSYSEKNLRRRGVQMVMGEGVASVDKNGLTLQGGRRIESFTMVWTAGAKPTPVLEKLDLPRNKRGALITNADFSIPEASGTGHGGGGLWALGDCAGVPDGATGKTFPATAQHAIREGPVLAKNIIAHLRGKPTKAFRYTSMGSMASLGARRGVAQLPGDFVLTGFIAWFLWRTYYLSRLPGNDRKLRVSLDWFIGLFFPRDIAELRVFTERSRTSSVSDAGMQKEPQ